MLKFFNKGHGTADWKTSSEFINLHLTCLNDFPPETPVQLQGIQHDYHFFLYLLYKIQLLIMFCFPTFLAKFLTDSFLLFQQINSMTWPVPWKGTQFHDFQLKPMDLSKALPECCHPLQLFSTQEMHLAKNRIYCLYPKQIMQFSPRENFPLSGWREEKEKCENRDKAATLKNQ